MTVGLTIVALVLGAVTVIVPKSGLPVVGATFAAPTELVAAFASGVVEAAGPASEVVFGVVVASF